MFNIKTEEKKKFWLYRHSQIHVLHSPVYNIIQERKLQYGNYTKFTEPFVIAHFNSHIFEKDKNIKVDKQDWFNLISVACSCHRSIFSYSSFIVIQWYLWSVTKSASTVIFLYCQTNLICNNRFFPLLYEKEKFQRCWPI